MPAAAPAVAQLKREGYLIDIAVDLSWRFGEPVTFGDQVSTMNEKTAPTKAAEMAFAWARK
jgi:hypothetical protein